MIRSKLLILFVFVVIGGALGCGSASGSKEPGGDGAGLSGMKAVFEVPAGYTGPAKTLTVAGYRSWPPSSMPDAFFTMQSSPTIAVGAPFVFERNDIEEQGAYHIVGFLYVQGSWMPVCGRDYMVAYPGNPITLDGGSLDLGTLVFDLVMPPISCTQP